MHRDVLAPSGAIYTARRAREGVEFLASTDAWFRPVNMYIGPDGAIYLLDFYRLSIEHPEWMATQTHNSPDLYKGDDRGRVYRITPGAAPPLPNKLHLSTASIEELVQYLASPNIWWRRTAQRLLVDRPRVQAVPLLTKLFETSQLAVARLHALWTLDALGERDPKLIEKALHDPEAGVHENAIVMAEAALPQHPELLDSLLKLENDSDGRVQFQLLCMLGGVKSPSSIAAQDRLLAKHIDDPWMQIAALSASPDRALQLFKAARAFTNHETEARATYFRQLASVIAARRKPEEIRQVVETIAGAATSGATWWRVAALQGLSGGRGGGRPASAGQSLLLKMFEGPDPAVRRASLRLLSPDGLPLRRAAETAERSDADSELRADSISLLALADPLPYAEMLKKLVDPKQPEAVQGAAVRALGRIKGTEIAAFLIDRWRTMTPSVRMDAADAMFTDPARPKLLVEAIKTDRIQPWTLAFRHKRNLVMSRDAGLREEARGLLEEKAGDREKVLQRYETSLTMNGDPQNGKEVFNRVCSKCHKFNGIGHEVGPDLATIRNRPPQLILPDIIMPNKSIAQGYESYVIETKSSGVIEGVLGPQTPTSFTVRHENGKQDIVRRNDIREMRATNLSAMPADLDKQVTIQQMADLLKYLKSSQ